jgi:alpha-1,2-mannosyltransferase
LKGDVHLVLMMCLCRFQEKLEKGMTNFFRRIRPENPVVRNNYFIQVDDNLAWSESIGDEDKEGIGWYTAVSAP